MRDLADCLVKMGARIKGAGTSTIEIEGVASLSGARHAVLPDRIEAGTYAFAVAMTGGEILFEGGDESVSSTTLTPPTTLRLYTCAATVYLKRESTDVHPFCTHTPQSA